MTFEEALSFIGNVKWQNSKPGLSRTRELLSRLGNPEQKLKFIHVAGTNGKGSTCAMMASMLQEAGYRVGLYTSPYIDHFTERFRVNGEDISPADLARLTEKIRPFAESMEDAPTEFEIITVLAFLFFLEQKCDIVVLEVGMGGELDSTNVIPVPEVAVITSIGLDHTAWLGTTIPEIAAAKAGIIKEGGDVVVYGRDPEAEAVFERVCEERNARLMLPSYETLNPVLSDLSGLWFDYYGFQNLKLSLVGRYQMYNAAVAITAMRVLNRKPGAAWHVSDEAIRTGLEKTRWGGRLEVVSRRPLVLADGSHNPQGFAATLESLEEILEGRKCVFLVTVSADKDVHGAMSQLVPMAQEFVAAAHGNAARAMPAGELAELLRQLTEVPVTEARSMAEGCELALEKAGRNGIVVAIGSLFAVGDMCREMRKLLHTAS